MKVSILGCGLRTPLLLSSLLKTGRVPSEVVLFDLESRQAQLMAALGRATAPESPTLVRVAASAEDAVSNSDFVICSIRPGGMEARARDERISLDLGYTGQETTGPAGFAMAWRTIPAVLAYVRLIEKLAPKAWLINFTNPAGLVTQAVRESSCIRVAGICDTPAELFFRIALSFGVDLEEVSCQYFGLNHLGFVRRVLVRGENRTAELLADNQRLESLYPAPLFPPAFIRHLQLIPTEYVYFYCRPEQARENQLRVGRTRGEELLQLNQCLYSDLAEATEKHGPSAGLAIYARYLNQRNASYLQLEAGGLSAFSEEPPDWDPFAAVSGYHRIAVDTIQALCGAQTKTIVLNVVNGTAIGGLDAADVVEINCEVDGNGVHPIAQSPIPREVLGLIESTKAYERTLVRATIEPSKTIAQWAMTQHPLIRDWDEAVKLVRALLPDS